MYRRSRAREVALQVLFVRDANPAVERGVIERFVSERLRDARSSSYALSLIDGVMQRREEIDQKLADASENWRLPRMAAVDRNVLRLGAFELLAANPDAPPPVVLDEAVELAKRFGSADSPAFVNGVLDKVRAALAAATPTA